VRYGITPPAWWPLYWWPLGSASTVPVGDCYCTALGKQATVTGTGKYATITGTSYQATITGANG
jgi:hypothetical protein